MRFGLELMSKVTSPERAAIVDRSLNSLARTHSDLGHPVLLLTHGVGAFDYKPYISQMCDKFEIVSRPDPPHVAGIGICVDGGYTILREFPDVTHIVFLWDDFIYNPEWLHQLDALIFRHPDAIAWHVYRSRYTRHHWILGGDGTDVIMSMHDGIGCVTREEWLAYKNFHNGFDFTTANGCTPDIHHAEMRPGERWATGRDYMQNLGRHKGIEQYDCAIDFVGE